ncbi:PREDICTED: uncharacterized protein LOC105460913, partial [Wasmannia auropunctata]|uniref:uncharacterized protein LOC105460913 n=1 Tax=Wasmannia auropunctata TaxID=64793 RepID=UPI0005ED7B7A
FIDNPDGGKPIIAGMNVLGINAKGQKDVMADFQFKSEKLKCTYEIMGSATKMAYECYGVDKYLYAYGLSVDPVYRGYGLGKDILKIRYDLYKDVSSQIKIEVTFIYKLLIKKWMKHDVIDSLLYLTVQIL